MVLGSFESFFVPCVARFLVHQRVRLAVAKCPLCILSECLLGTFSPSLLATAKFHYGSKAQTAFGGILTRSMILIE
jgi:hypothetical protein